MSRNENRSGTLNAYLVNGNEVEAGDRYGYKIILVVFEDIQGFCAYRGDTEDSDGNTVQSGDPVSYIVAENLFPVVYRTLIDRGYSYGDY